MEIESFHFVYFRYYWYILNRINFIQVNKFDDFSMHYFFHWKVEIH